MCRVYGNLLGQILSRAERSGAEGAIKYSGRARDATLSCFQALPFARPTLITFRVLKRNYLGCCHPPPLGLAPPVPEMRRAGKTRKRKDYIRSCLSERLKSGQTLRNVDVMIFSSFSRALSVHERLLSEKQLKHG